LQVVQFIGEEQFVQLFGQIKGGQTPLVGTPNIQDVQLVALTEHDKHEALQGKQLLLLKKYPSTHEVQFF